MISFRSLLVGEDDSTAVLIRRVCTTLGVDTEHVRDADLALQKLRDERFDVAMVDDRAPEVAVKVLDAAKALPPSKPCLGVVLAEPLTSCRVVFATGAHMLLYRPITPERVLNGMRALRNLLGRNPHRESQRFALNTAATLKSGSRENIQATLLDLSTGGAALSLSEPVKLTATVLMKTLLPDNTEPFTATCEVVWQESENHIGVRFIEVASQSRHLLQGWIASQKKALRSNQTRLRNEKRDVQHENERSAERHGPNVPIEIKNDGSPPIYASTTDLSLGGCYVETSFPLPADTNVDLRLQVGHRTLQIAATMVTCDPQVGNGIKFNDMLAEYNEVLCSYLEAQERTLTLNPE
jgi:CheY-like chemotaxis protein